MSDIVKYHNDMNKINFSNYSEKELNLFFSLIFMAKDMGVNELEIPFNELKKICDGDKNRERFIKNIVNVNEKLIKLNHKIEIDSVIHIFSLFNRFSIDKKQNKLIIQINDMFSYLLNDLIGNFTKFDLLEFVSLKSSYSKNLFKLLKQWESVKLKEFSIEEFRNVLAIPEKYRISEIDKFVLKPIMEELPKYFYNLKVEKIKTGRRVTSLKFTWENKKLVKDEILDLSEEENEIVEVKISEELNKAIEKAKKNRYIEKFLNIDNIEILLDMFEENDLIKGLIWAYKEVKQEITSLNYLVKTIKTGITKKERKLVVVQEEQEKVALKLEKEEQKEVQKMMEAVEITREEYEELYSLYLSENNLENNLFIKKSFDLMNRKKFKIIN